MIQRCGASVVLIGLLAGVARADPLDQVTGTETWGQPTTPVQDFRAAERREWVNARLRWRTALVELRREERNNHRLAAFLYAATRPTAEQLWQAAGVRRSRAAADGGRR